MKKKIMHCCLLSAGGSSAFAQIEKDKQFFAFGTFADITRSHTDATPNRYGLMYGVDARYYYRNFIGLKLTAARAELNGGFYTYYTAQSSYYPLAYHNTYYQTDVSFRFYPLMLTGAARTEKDMYVLSHTYFGAGIGLMFCNTCIPDIDLPVFRYKQHFNGSETVIPVEVGWDFPVTGRYFFEPGLLLNINCRMQYCLSDRMDGLIPDLPANRRKDVFSAVTIGLVYRF